MHSCLYVIVLICFIAIKYYLLFCFLHNPAEFHVTGHSFIHWPTEMSFPPSWIWRYRGEWKIKWLLIFDSLSGAWPHLNIWLWCLWFTFAERTKIIDRYLYCVFAPPFPQNENDPKLRGLVTVSLDPVGMWWYRSDCSGRAGAHLGIPPLLSTRQLSAVRSPANIYTAATLARLFLPLSADVKEQLLP